MDDILDPDYCPDAAKYGRLVRAGKRHEAEKFAAGKVREGPLSKRMQTIVADIVDPDVRRSRGRPVGSHLDELWHEIGRDFEDLTRGGVSAGSAYDALADEYAVGRRTIEKIVGDYRKIMRNAFEQMQAWEEEFDSWSEEEKDGWYREIEQARRDAADDTPPSAGNTEIDEYDAWAGDALRACPHGCEQGCRRSTLLADRHRCPFSAAPRKKSPI